MRRTTRPPRHTRPGFSHWLGKLTAPLLAVLLGCLAVLPAPWPADAHAYLESAEPAPGSTVPRPPARLRLVFSEPVDSSFSRVHVLDSRGQRVDAEDSRVAGDDPRSMVVTLRSGVGDGLYTVVWRTLSSVDGHDLTGSYPLVFGAALGQAPAPTTSSTSNEPTFAVETGVARWLLFVAASALFGSLLAWLVVLHPLVRGYPPALDAVRRRTNRLAIASAALLLLATLYAALAQAAVAAGVPLWSVFGSPLVSLLSRGRFAVVWWLRLAMVIAVVTALPGSRLAGYAPRLGLVLAAGVMLTSSMTGHGAALASGAYLAVAADWLHFLAVGTWIGGLALLAYALPALPGPDRAALLKPIAQRFSALALGTVVVITATGVFQAWLQVGSWDALGETGYGLSIVAKVLLMTVMLGFAGFNLVWARSRGPSTASTHSGGHLVPAVRAELALGVGVLIAAAILTGLVPARQELAQRATGESHTGPVDRRLDVQGVSPRVSITPAEVGQNAFSVELPGVDPREVERVQLTLTFLDADLGSQPLVLQPTTPNGGTVWTASAPLLSQAGAWQAGLLVRRTGKDDLDTAFRFTVAGTGTPAMPRTVAADYPLLPSPMATFGYALAGTGVVLAIGSAVRGRRRLRSNALTGIVAGLLVAGYGGFVYAREQRNGIPLDVANVRNPIPADAQSLAAGKAIYDSRCAACHGDTGRGDGPAGVRLVPRPADLRIHMAAGHTDGQLFYWVSYGVPGSAMPAWRNDLSEADRWNIINYIRTFANSNS